MAIAIALQMNRYRQRHQSLMINGGKTSSGFPFIVHVDCYQIVNRADPRFSIEGGTNSEEPTYSFAKISEKPHEIRRGGPSARCDMPGPPLMKSSILVLI